MTYAEFIGPHTKSTGDHSPLNRIVLYELYCLDIINITYAQVLTNFDDTPIRRLAATISNHNYSLFHKKEI